MTDFASGMKMIRASSKLLTKLYEKFIILLVLERTNFFRLPLLANLLKAKIRETVKLSEMQMFKFVMSQHAVV